MFYLEGFELLRDELGANDLWHRLVGRQPIVMEMRPSLDHLVKVHPEQRSHLPIKKQTKHLVSRTCLTLVTTAPYCPPLTGCMSTI